MGTTIYGRLAAVAGGQLVTVDHDPKQVAFARALSHDLPVAVVQDDSVHYLQAHKGPEWDVAYLDSQDTYVPGYVEHCLAEAQAVEPHVARDGIILIDDTPPLGKGWGGKGAAAVPWLLSQGWYVAKQGYQTLLRRCPT